MVRLAGYCPSVNQRWRIRVSAIVAVGVVGGVVSLRFCRRNTMRDTPSVSVDARVEIRRSNATENSAGAERVAKSPSASERVVAPEATMDAHLSATDLDHLRLSLDEIHDSIVAAWRPCFVGRAMPSATKLLYRYKLSVATATATVEEFALVDTEIDVRPQLECMTEAIETLSVVTTLADQSRNVEDVVAGRELVDVPKRETPQ
jgi:hypothetical protein